MLDSGIDEESAVWANLDQRLKESGVPLFS